MNYPLEVELLFGFSDYLLSFFSSVSFLSYDTFFLVVLEGLDPFKGSWFAFWVVITDSCLIGVTHLYLLLQCGYQVNLTSTMVNPNSLGPIYEYYCRGLLHSIA